ncbi:MAG: hypothetical protein U0457_01640 [Candidatus Sericytochromatia bacterium]
MKKLHSLFALVTTLSVFTACNSRLSENIEEQVAPTQQVKSLSVQGASYAYKTMVKMGFTSLDKNKDGSLSFDEYKVMFNPPQPVPQPPTPSAQPNPDPAPSSAPDPQPAPSANPSVNADNIVKDTNSTGEVKASSATPSKPLTPEQLFKKVDKNADGKLSLTEAYDSKYFIGYSQSDMRKSINKMYFKDTFKYSNGRYSGTIDLDKFVSLAGGLSRDRANELFYSADKNFDNKLNFSEAEDLIYNMMRVQLNPPAPVPSELPVEPSVAPSA